MIFFAISENTLAVTDSGNSDTTDNEVPNNEFIFGSIGNVPRCGMLAYTANSCPPLEENIFVQLLQ